MKPGKSALLHAKKIKNKDKHIHTFNSLATNLQVANALTETLAKEKMPPMNEIMKIVLLAWEEAEKKNSGREPSAELLLEAMEKSNRNTAHDIFSKAKKFLRERIEEYNSPRTTSVDQMTRSTARNSFRNVLPAMPRQGEQEQEVANYIDTGGHEGGDWGNRQGTTEDKEILSDLIKDPGNRGKFFATSYI